MSTITMTGVAPTDLELSKYMAELNAYSLLKDVMLEFMKGQPVSATRVTATPLKFTPFLKWRPPAEGLAEGSEEWEGVLDVGSQKLRLVLHLEKEPRGSWQAELRSVDQGNTTSPIEAVENGPSTVRFEVNTIGATYEGTRTPDGSGISGQWKQAGTALPLTFRRLSAARK